MKKYLKTLVPAAIIAAAAVVILIKETGKTPPEILPETSVGSGSSRGLPTLIDLGANKCIPCKKMAPILEELKEEYRGRLEVIFIDVWQDPTAGRKYGIRLIPTQIFYDAEGKELGRHEGFIGKDDILTAFRKFGVTLPEPGKKEG